MITKEEFEERKNAIQAMFQKQQNNDQNIVGGANFVSKYSDFQKSKEQEKRKLGDNFDGEKGVVLSFNNLQDLMKYLKDYSFANYMLSKDQQIQAHIQDLLGKFIKQSKSIDDIVKFIGEHENILGVGDIYSKIKDNNSTVVSKLEKLFVGKILLCGNVGAISQALQSNKNYKYPLEVNKSEETRQAVKQKVLKAMENCGSFKNFIDLRAKYNSIETLLNQKLITGHEMDQYAQKVFFQQLSNTYNKKSFEDLIKDYYEYKNPYMDPSLFISFSEKKQMVQNVFDKVKQTKRLEFKKFNEKLKQVIQCVPEEVQELIMRKYILINTDSKQTIENNIQKIKDISQTFENIDKYYKNYTINTHPILEKHKETLTKAQETDHPELIQGIVNEKLYQYYKSLHNACKGYLRYTEQNPLEKIEGLYDLIMDVSKPTIGKILGPLYDQESGKINPLYMLIFNKQQKSIFPKQGEIEYQNDQIEKKYCELNKKQEKITNALSNIKNIVWLFTDGKSQEELRQEEENKLKDQQDNLNLQFDTLKDQENTLDNLKNGTKQEVQKVAQFSAKVYPCFRPGVFQEMIELLWTQPQGNANGDQQDLLVPQAPNLLQLQGGADGDQDNQLVPQPPNLLLFQNMNNLAGQHHDHHDDQPQ